MFAVEYHLDTICGTKGAGVARQEEPWLLPRLEKLQVDLTRCLVEVWEAKSVSVHPTGQLLSALQMLAYTFVPLQLSSIDLVHEVGRPIGALD